MRIPRIYYSGDLNRNETIFLDRSASQHVCKVLRLETGAQLVLFNGRGASASAILQSVSPKSASVQIINELYEATESDLNLHLGLGISKGDRMDYAIQKAVELGVSAITPLVTERTIVRLDEKKQQKKLEHWHGIILSACEQSGRTLLPELNPVVPLNKWLPHSSDCKLVFTPQCEQSITQLEKYKQVSILIGPEGGLSENEITNSVAENFQCLQLGPRVLRTETAVVSACSVLQLLWGDLG